MSRHHLAPADWIGIGAIALPMLGGIAYLTYRTGEIVNKIEKMQVQVDKIPGIENRIEKMQVQVDKIPGMELKIVGMEVKVEELWREKISKSHSPIVLNENGKRILATSHLGWFSNEYYNEILAKVKSLNPQNPYQAQEFLISVVAEYKNDKKCKLLLEAAAYQSGSDVVTVLFVAAMTIRDRIMTDLGFYAKAVDQRHPRKV